LCGRKRQRKTEPGFDFLIPYFLLMVDHKVSFEKVPQLELRIHNNAAGFCPAALADSVI